jgi:hypothetical protein
MDAADVVRIVSGDPGAYEEAIQLCVGTLWKQGLVTGLLKCDDMIVVNRGRPRVAPEVLAGEGRDAAAAVCGEAIYGLAASLAAREHGISLRRQGTVTSALLAAGLAGVDWPEVGSKFLAATLARLSWQAAHVGAVGEAGGGGQHDTGKAERDHPGDPGHHRRVHHGDLRPGPVPAGAEPRR